MLHDARLHSPHQSRRVLRRRLARSDARIPSMWKIKAGYGLRVGKESPTAVVSGSSVAKTRRRWPARTQQPEMDTECRPQPTALTSVSLMGLFGPCMFICEEQRWEIAMAACHWLKGPMLHSEPSSKQCLYFTSSYIITLLIDVQTSVDGEESSELRDKLLRADDNRSGIK